MVEERAPTFVRVDVVGARSQREHSEPLATGAALEFAQPATERTAAQVRSNRADLLDAGAC
jgi:hypothetical protein